MKLGFSGRASVSAVTPRTISRHGSDDTTCIHLPDALIVGIPNVDIAGSINSHVARKIKHSFSGRASVAAVAFVTISRHGSDDTTCIHLPDTVIVGISNVDIAGSINSHAERKIKHSFSGRASVAAVAFVTISRHGSDDTTCIHLPDTVIVEICDVDIAGSINSHSARIRKHSFSSRSTIATVTPRTISRHCVDYDSIISTYATVSLI